MHGHEPGFGRGHDVVVDAVAHVGDLAGAHPDSRTTRAKNAGDGFSIPQLADEPITSTGSDSSRAQRSIASVWLPATPTV